MAGSFQEREKREERITKAKDIEAVKTEVEELIKYKLEEMEEVESLLEWLKVVMCSVSEGSINLMRYCSDRTPITLSHINEMECILARIKGIVVVKLADAFLSEVNISTESLKFIDSESCTIGDIKRTSENNKIIYAFVLTDIREHGLERIVGREFTSGELLVVYCGQSNKIRNGDDLLVFGFYSGLALDDTPNFIGHYIRIINGRLVDREAIVMDEDEPPYMW